MATGTLSMLMAPAVMMTWSYLDINTDKGSPGLFYLRCFFATSMVAAFTMLFVSKIRIGSRLNGDTRKVTVKTTPTDGTDPVDEKITCEEHDLRAFQKALQQQGMILVVMAFMHLKFGYVRPLVIQSVLMPMTFLKSNLGRVYILGESDTGDLKRPWTQAVGPLQAMLEQQQQGGDTDTKKKKK